MFPLFATKGARPIDSARPRILAGLRRRHPAGEQRHDLPVISHRDRVVQCGKKSRVRSSRAKPCLAQVRSLVRQRAHARCDLGRHTVVAQDITQVAQAAGFALDDEMPERDAGLCHQQGTQLPGFGWCVALVAGVEAGKRLERRSSARPSRPSAEAFSWANSSSSRSEAGWTACGRASIPSVRSRPQHTAGRAAPRRAPSPVASKGRRSWHAAA